MQPLEIRLERKVSPEFLGKGDRHRRRNDTELLIYQSSVAAATPPTWYGYSLKALLILL
jgi:hypothetical protein